MVGGVKFTYRPAIKGSIYMGGEIIYFDYVNDIVDEYEHPEIICLSCGKDYIDRFMDALDFADYLEYKNSDMNYCGGSERCLP